MKDLYEKKTYATGTMAKNQKGFPKEIKGVIAEYNKKTKRFVNLCERESSLYSLEGYQVCGCRVKPTSRAFRGYSFTELGERKKKDVPIPIPIYNYNKFMGV